MHPLLQPLPVMVCVMAQCQWRLLPSREVRDRAIWWLRSWQLLLLLLPHQLQGPQFWQLLLSSWTLPVVELHLLAEAPINGPGQAQMLMVCVPNSSSSSNCQPSAAPLLH